MDLALVGCGGMGLRHTMGYIELRRQFDSFRLAAVCDLHEQPATYIASQVEQALGQRPAVYTDFERMVDETRLDAVDIVTDTRAHHRFALDALEAGLHVMVEKPMAITLAACRAVRDAAAKAGLTLAVAENFRRDPMNRLVKALLDGGAIGRPRFVVKMGVGGGSNLMHNTGWRALKQRAGSHILENGVHDADLLLYFMGDVESIFAETGIFTNIRRRAGVSGQLAQFYQHRVEDEFADQDRVEVDTEDSAFGVLKFTSGAAGQFTLSSASHGHGIGVNSIHGELGTLLLPPSRTGRGPEIRLEDSPEPLTGDRLLATVPDFQLDDMTAAFWNGRRRMSSYEMSFEEIDRKLVAIEYQDFSEAIQTGREPEVGHEAAMKALALAYGLLESGHARRPVTLNDVMTGAVSDYQKEIDDSLAAS